MIENLDTLTAISDTINADTATSYSVKMRLGMSAPDGWRGGMPILNDTRLAHITLHPRTAAQMYSGELYLDEFRSFLQASKAPVIYNGEIRTTDDIDRLRCDFPAVSGVMIGRGLLARPSLTAEWKDGSPWNDAERLQRLLEFHSRLLDEYRATLCGDTQILQKIKPFWEYLEPEIGHKSFKAIHKATTLPRYEQAVATIG